MTSEISALYKEFIYPIYIKSEACEGEILVLQSSYWSKIVECQFEEELLKAFFESLSRDERKAYFHFGVASVSCFVQINFTGPELSKVYAEFLDKVVVQLPDCSKLLSLDFQDINVNTKYPILLQTAKCIFKYCSVDSVVNIWWQCRTLLIHQQIFDSLVPLLLSDFDKLQQYSESFQLEGDVQAEFELEQTQLHILYGHISKAYTHVNTAQHILGIDYELIGKIGKRTRYQQTEVAQLTLCIKTKEKAKVEQLPYEVPQNIFLEDDVILDNIEFTDNEVIESLSDTEQKLLLTALQLMLISQPQDNLYYEEVKPYINMLLKQNSPWVVRVITLLIRCKFEAKHKRLIERSLMQCGEIVNAIKSESPTSSYRVYDVYSTSILPIWKTEELLGNLMLSLGLVKAALEVFLRLQNWEAVITCYTLLKLRHKAAEIIQQQLNIKPSVKLWCYLGDATDNIDCYHKAWEISNETSFLAQYHLGFYYYHRRQYKECIFHLEKSVSINSLQPNAWLYLGYAALEIENWECAAAAYRHFTSLEPGSFETWNNLAKAYIKLGNKQAAHHALHDALKCNYDNWKVWDNLMAVSADIGHFSDVIRSYHRILDLKDKHLDAEVLEILVRGVCSDIRDSDGNAANRLLTKTRELFGRITSINHADDGHLWELYARLTTDQFIKIQRLQRSLKGLMNPEWERNPEKCIQVLIVCKQLLESSLSDDINTINPILNSVKLSLRSVVTIIKKMQYTETVTLVDEIDIGLCKLLQKIENGQKTNK